MVQESVFVFDGMDVITHQEHGNYFQYHPTEESKTLLQRLLGLEAYQRPKWYCPNIMSLCNLGHYQLYPNPFTWKQVFEDEEGGTFAVDWAYPETIKATNPVLVIIPGIGGGEDDPKIDNMGLWPVPH